LIGWGRNWDNETYSERKIVSHSQGSSGHETTFALSSAPLHNQSQSLFIWNQASASTSLTSPDPISWGNNQHGLLVGRGQTLFVCRAIYWVLSLTHWVARGSRCAVSQHRSILQGPVSTKLCTHLLSLSGRDPPPPFSTAPVISLLLNRWSATYLLKTSLLFHLQSRISQICPSVLFRFFHSFYARTSCSGYSIYNNCLSTKLRSTRTRSRISEITIP
jgi:hypothetical protein